VAERSFVQTPGSLETVRPDDRLAAIVVDAAIEVHRHLGPAFAESVYENALAWELGSRGVPHVRQLPVYVTYKDQRVGEGRMDLLVGERLVVEIKSLPAILPVHVSQVISYLRATRLELGLLLNFGGRRLKDGIRRVILSATTEDLGPR
jgi:GxxExxY protein